jgi:hypothetical protein
MTRCVHLAKESVMKAIACLPLLFFGFCAFTNGGEKKKSDSIKMDMSYLEKKWGIKYKSHSVQDSEFKTKTIKILLEFTKDVDDLKEMRRAFGEFKTGPFPLWFVYFDDENVSLAKFLLTRVEGELSGKKGDAFRVFLGINGRDFEKTRRIEARPGEAEKDKSRSLEKDKK